MLEQLRRNSRSFIIWILFGIIIAVFIVSFGPQANPESLGCGASAEYAMEVEGEEVGLGSWRFAMNGLRGGGNTAARSQRAFDLLVERELLAQAAEERGFRVPDDVVNKAIAAGEFYILGHRIRIDQPGFWRDYRQLEQFSTSLGMPGVAQLVEEQRREHLAEYMRHLFLTSSTVSAEEVRQRYIQENTKVTVDYVKFDVARYRSALELGEEDIQRYAASRQGELEKAWEQEKAQWSTERDRVLARHILVLPEPAEGEEASAARDRARAEAEAARARITGGASFGEVAREVSDDKLTRARGGLLGWRPAESLGYGTEVVEAAKGLEVGQVSEVVETTRGFHLLKIEDRSDKALTFEQKRMDLAARQATDHYARALARRDAERALAKASGKKLDEVFERKASPPPSFGAGELPEGLPPEILEQLEQIQREQGGSIQFQPGPAGEGAPGEGGEGAAPAGEGAAPGGEGQGEEAGEGEEPGDETGSLILREGRTVRAQAGGTEPAAPPPASAPGSAGGDAAAAAEAEQLPEVKVEEPGVQSVGPVSRSRSFLAGVGESEELLTDLFENLEVGAVSGKVYPVGGTTEGFVIVQLTAREDADETKLDDEREELTASLSYEKGVSRLASWLVKRCQSATRDGDIKVNRRILEDEDDPQKRFDYQPCATFSEIEIFRQLASRPPR